jgi:hypothetical protein
LSLCFNGLRKDDGGNPKRDADKMEKSKLLFNNPSGCFIIVYIPVVGSAKACGAKGFYQSMGEFRGVICGPENSNADAGNGVLPVWSAVGSF